MSNSKNLLFPQIIHACLFVEIAENSAFLDNSDQTWPTWRGSGCVHASQTAFKVIPFYDQSLSKRNLSIDSLNVASFVQVFQSSPEFDQSDPKQPEVCFFRIPHSSNDGSSHISVGRAAAERVGKASQSIDRSTVLSEHLHEGKPVGSADRRGQCQREWNHSSQTFAGQTCGKSSSVFVARGEHHSQQGRSSSIDYRVSSQDRIGRDDAGLTGAQVFRLFFGQVGRRFGSFFSRSHAETVRRCGVRVEGERTVPCRRNRLRTAYHHEDQVNGWSATHVCARLSKIITVLLLWPTCCDLRLLSVPLPAKSVYSSVCILLLSFLFVSKCPIDLLVEQIKSNRAINRLIDTFWSPFSARVHLSLCGKVSFAIMSRSLDSPKVNNHFFDGRDRSATANQNKLTHQCIITSVFTADDIADTQFGSTITDNRSIRVKKKASHRSTRRTKQSFNRLEEIHIQTSAFLVIARICVIIFSLFTWNQFIVSLQNPKRLHVCTDCNEMMHPDEEEIMGQRTHFKSHLDDLTPDWLKEKESTGVSSYWLGCWLIASSINWLFPFLLQQTSIMAVEFDGGVVCGADSRTTLR